MSLRYALNGGPLPPKDWGKSRTRQSEAKYADINVIMAKYEKSGMLPAASAEGFYADVSQVGDFREAIERVQRGDEIFMTLDAKVRKEFNNDVSEFLDFVTDKENREANLAHLKELGVVQESSPVTEPAPVEETPASNSVPGE